MYRLVLRIDGMHCGMCESFVNNAVRECTDAVKVKSSARKGETVILSKTPPDAAKITAAIEGKGYRVLASGRAEAVKRGLFGKYRCTDGQTE